MLKIYNICLFCLAFHINYLYNSIRVVKNYRI